MSKNAGRRAARWTKRENRADHVPRIPYRDTWTPGQTEREYRIIPAPDTWTTDADGYVVEPLTNEGERGG